MMVRCPDSGVLPLLSAVLACLCTPSLADASCSGHGTFQCYNCLGHACKSGCCRGDVCVKIDGSDLPSQTIGYSCGPAPVLEEKCTKQKLVAGGEMTACFCNEDFCNGASLGKSPTLLMLVAITTAVLVLIVRF